MKYSYYISIKNSNLTPKKKKKKEHCTCLNGCEDHHFFIFVRSKASLTLENKTKNANFTV